MAERGRGRSRGIVATVAVLVPLAAFVVWSSFQVSAVECEVCMAFDGQEVCRTVTGQTEAEGIRAGIDNACGTLTSGVTNTLRCSRTPPTRASCRPL